MRPSFSFFFNFNAISTALSLFTVFTTGNFRNSLPLPSVFFLDVRMQLVCLFHFPRNYFVGGSVRIWVSSLLADFPVAVVC